MTKNWRKLSAVCAVVLLTGCNASGGIPGIPGMTYQQALSKLCARPDIMQNVINTPQLQQGWDFICQHVASVSPTPIS